MRPAPPTRRTSLTNDRRRYWVPLLLDSPGFTVEVFGDGAVGVATVVLAAGEEARIAAVGAVEPEGAHLPGEG